MFCTLVSKPSEPHKNRNSFSRWTQLLKNVTDHMAKNREYGIVSQFSATGFRPFRSGPATCEIMAIMPKTVGKMRALV